MTASYHYVGLRSDFAAHAGSGRLHRCRPPACGWIVGPMLAGIVIVDRSGVFAAECLCLAGGNADHAGADLGKHRQNHGQSAADRADHADGAGNSEPHESFEYHPGSAARSLQIGPRQQAARRCHRSDATGTSKSRSIRCRARDRRRASAFSISFYYPDRVKAHDTVQALITKFQEANLDTQRTQQKVVEHFRA